jgi:DNA-directed RNA polymerase specialized sigma54-like protein
VELELELRQRQELSLSPQLLEAMEILQMNTYDCAATSCARYRKTPCWRRSRPLRPMRTPRSSRASWNGWTACRTPADAAARDDDPVMELASRITSPLWEDTLEAHLKLQLPGWGSRGGGDWPDTSSMRGRQGLSG